MKNIYYIVKILNILVNRSWFHLISYYEKYILYSENIKLSMCNIGIMKKVEQLVVLSTL